MSSVVAGCVVTSTFEVGDDRSGKSSKSQRVYCCYRNLLPLQEGQLCLECKFPKILRFAKYAF